MNKKDVIKYSTNPSHINFDGTLKIKRVAIYARVSTKKDLQLSSFELQISTYLKQINDNPLWELSGIFADHGKSGTSITKRREFMKMLELARLGEIDIIITKSISRFTRDIVSGLKTIQELRDLGVEIRFEKENITTSDTSFDFFLTIFTSVAEEEAKSNSTNVLWAYKKKMSNGGNTTSRLYGYNFDKEGNFTINNDQAPAVQLIYKLYSEGKTLNEIIEAVHERGYRTFNNNPKFTVGAIKSILRNEKYCGDMVLQKTTITKMGSGESKANISKPKYYVSNSHEGIISKELFNNTQALIKERALIFNKQKNDLTTFNYSSYVYSVTANKFYRSKTNHKNTNYEIRMLEVVDQNRNRILEVKSLFYRQIDVLLAEGSKALLVNVNNLKAEFQYEANVKMKREKVDESTESLRKQIDDLNSELKNIDQLSINEDAKNQYKDNISAKLNDTTDKLLALKHQKLMQFTYDKNIPLFLKKLNKIKNDENANLKELFNYVIAIDRDELLLCIHLSNRNIDDITLSNEIHNSPVKTGTFKFIQTRLSLDVKWSIIII